MIVNFFVKGVLVLSLFLCWQGCAPADGDETGHEYMPDMYHSIAYEANLYNYYKFNTWGTELEYKDFTIPRTPVKGTVPRGYTSFSYGSGSFPSNASIVDVNGFVPYYYGNTEEERLRAMEEITTNPFPISEEALAKGQSLYNIYCSNCHGGSADGTGYLVREDGGVYPVQPANLLLEEFVNASEGRYYHTIMHGRNMMGSHTDKLSYEERWQVIHYIRSLQAQSQGLVYSPTENTLNNSAIPVSKIQMNDPEKGGNPESLNGETGHH